MNLAFSEADLAFRQEVRDFLALSLPNDIRDRCARGYIVGNDDLIRWQRILNAQGWMAPNWPVEYGGAGSDLARLKTRAVCEGDHYVINGHKIWTSYAHWANRMFCLVRTDPDAKAQEGISFMLIDMNTPSIEIRPIIGLDMGHTLNEVFLDDVRVPVKNRVGEENKGWTYAKYLLQKERNFVARVAQSRHLVGRLKTIAGEQQVGDGFLIDSADFRRRLTALEIDLRALEYTELRYLSRELQGAPIGPEPSLLKIKGSEIQQALKQLLVESLGIYSALYQNDMMPIASDYLEIGPAHMQGIMAEHLYGRGATIFGGSNEIQRNIIARMLLRS